MPGRKGREKMTPERMLELREKLKNDDYLGEAVDVIAEKLAMNLQKREAWTKKQNSAAENAAKQS
jgi:hypothetical protein